MAEGSAVDQMIARQELEADDRGMNCFGREPALTSAPSQSIILES
jgi:hypothetical protein